MKKPKFEPEDFFDYKMRAEHEEQTKDWPDGARLKEFNPLAEWQRKLVTSIANAKLAEWEREGWQLVNVKDATVLYGEAGRDWWSGIKRKMISDTHRALLINIEPLVPKAPCEHEPVMDYDDDNGEWYSRGKIARCTKCGVKLTATWTEAT